MPLQNKTNFQMKENLTIKDIDRIIEMLVGRPERHFETTFSLSISGS